MIIRQLAARHGKVDNAIVYSGDIEILHKLQGDKRSPGGLVARQRLEGSQATAKRHQPPHCLPL